MSRLNIAPTKSNQIALKRDLAMASQGYSLLEQKREILVMELMRLIDKVKEAQANMERCSRKACATLRQALSYNGYHHMCNVAGGIQYDYRFSSSVKVVAGIRVPSLSVEQGGFKSQFGFAGTDSLVDQTMEDFLALTEAAGHLAELETAVWLLARELKKTQRRVNALEHIFIPNYRDTLHFIGEAIEGRELDTFFTMKMVKKRLEDGASPGCGKGGSPDEPV